MENYIIGLIIVFVILVIDFKASSKRRWGENK